MRSFIFVSFLICSFALSDEFHYRNAMVGDRAVGLGGAYVALADDPSGVYHNPAGLVYATENYFSLTANAYSATTLTYKDIVGGQDYVMRSQGLIPTFFGVTQYFLGGRLGLAIIVPNSELVDQDDKIENLHTTPGSSNTLLRKFSRQDTTYLAGPTYARALSDNLAAGVSLFALARLDRELDTQFVIYNPVGTGKYFFQDTYLNRMAIGLAPKFGLQYRLTPDWRVGLTAQYTWNLTGSGRAKVVKSKLDNSGVPILQNGQFENDVQTQDILNLFYAEPEILRVVLGTAFHLSDRFLVSIDGEYAGTDPNYLNYPIQPTFNWALGAEWKLLESVLLRFGIFSNNANTAAVVPGNRNQPQHVDLIGTSLAASLLGARTSLTGGMTFSYGRGDAQVISDNPDVQKLNQSTLTLYFSGSYQL